MSVRNLFKIPSYILFGLFILFWINVTYAQNSDNASVQENNIQILIIDDDGNEKVANVSKKDIEERVINGEPVHFVESLQADERTIPAKCINQALLRNVDAIKIKNAIIEGDIEFKSSKKHAIEDIKNLSEETRKVFIKNNIKFAYIIHTKIKLSNCVTDNIVGSFEPDTDNRNDRSLIIENIIITSFARNISDLTSVIFENEIVIYEKSKLQNVYFDLATFSSGANFNSATFSSKAYFESATFSSKADFESATFSSDADFESANFDVALFNSVTFSSDADFNSANFDVAYFNSVTFSSDAYFNSVTFSSDAYFNSANFSSDADFESAYFNSANFSSDADFESANFNAANFSSGANFNSATFSSEANFSHAKIYNANFTNTVFTNANLRFTNFINGADFWYAVFEGSVFFNNAKFDNDADFWRSRFLGNVEFEETEFLRNAYFSNVLFTTSMFSFASFRNADFSNSEFTSTADFSSVLFNDDVNFTKTQFVGLADFSKAKLKESAILNNTGFEDNSVDTRWMNYNKLFVTWDQIKDKLDMKKAQDNIVVWEGIYLSLIKNFENLGDFKSADNAYYDYRYMKSKLKDNNGIWKSLLNLILRFTCGYGVKPLYCLYTWGALIALFTMIYFFPSKDSLDYNIKDNNSESSIKCKSLKNSKPLTRLYNCFYFSVITFATVGLGDIRPNKGFKAAAIVESFLGWLTMALFLVTLGNVWLR